MIVSTKAGEIPIRRLTFPDGQPHVELMAGREFLEATMETAIRSPADLLDVLLVKNALDASGYVTSLDLRYLLGARMDRRISPREPATLDVIGRLLVGAGFRRIRVLDPHSSVTLSTLGASPVYPTAIVREVLARYRPSETIVIAPDKGATVRVETLMQETGTRDQFRVVQGLKHRDSFTGQLSGFGVENPSLIEGHGCLILDDLCDGGGTFNGLAAELRKAGALFVDLFVTHGIFSKGTDLREIRRIDTTDSYPHGFESLPGFVVHPIRLRDL